MVAYRILIACACMLMMSIPSQAGDKRIMGTLLGAGIGAAVGHSIDRTGGAGKGAVIGAIGGYLIGQQMDKPSTSEVSPPETHAYTCQDALNQTNHASRIQNKKKKVFLLQNALRICPNSARIHNDLGVAYYQRGLYYDGQRARLELQEALRIDPNYTIARRNLRAL